VSKLFGGSKQSSQAQSSNQAYGYLKDTFSPLTGYAGTGAQMLAGLLGGDPSGFNAYKKATGFDALTQEGSRGITGNAAAGGLLRSGGTGKAIANYGNMMQNQYADQYLQRALGLAGLGMNAGQLIGSAGNVSNSTSKSSSKPGLGGLLGAGLSIASGGFGG